MVEFFFVFRPAGKNAGRDRLGSALEVVGLHMGDHASGAVEKFQGVLGAEGAKVQGKASTRME